MCETTIKIKEQDTLREIAHDILKLEVKENGIHCYGPLGEEIFLENVEIVEARFTHPHELIVQKKHKEK